MAYTLHSPEEGELRLPALSPPSHTPCRCLISLDYDGTLRHEELGVEVAAFPILSSLKAQGALWGINTGRSLRKLIGRLETLPFMPDFICTCERYVYLADDKGRLCPATSYNARCYAANMALRDRLRDTWQAALERMRLTDPKNRWEIAADDPLSIEAEDSATMDRLMPSITAYVQQESHGEVSIQRAGRFMRLSDARYSKGSALRHIQQLHGIEEQKLFLMGDGHNDLDAFRSFPSAYCAAPHSAHADVLAWLGKHGGHSFPSVSAALLSWAGAQKLDVS